MHVGNSSIWFEHNVSSASDVMFQIRLGTCNSPTPLVEMCDDGVHATPCDDQRTFDNGGDGGGACISINIPPLGGNDVVTQSTEGGGGVGSRHRLILGKTKKGCTRGCTV
jgi:hypothetical protein